MKSFFIFFNVVLSFAEIFLFDYIPSCGLTSALSGSNLASVESAFAVLENSSQLPFLKAPSINFSTCEWLMDTKQSSGAFFVKGGKFSVGCGFVIFSIKPQQALDIYQEEYGKWFCEFGKLSFSCAQNLTDKWSVGFCLKYLFENLKIQKKQKKAEALLFDINQTLNLKKITFSSNLMRLPLLKRGYAQKFPIYRLLKIAVAYKIDPRNKLFLCLFLRDKPKVSLGYLFSFKIFDFLIGLDSQRLSDFGFSLSFGTKIRLRNIDLCFAFIPYGKLDDIINITVGYTAR